MLDEKSSTTPTLPLFLLLFPGGENANLILLSESLSPSICLSSTPSTCEGSSKVNSESVSANRTPLTALRFVDGAENDTDDGADDDDDDDDDTDEEEGLAVLLLSCTLLKAEGGAAAAGLEKEEEEEEKDAATAAGPTEDTEGKDRYEDAFSPGLSEVGGLIMLARGALSLCARASLEALSAAVTLMGRCLASSMGVFSSLSASKIRLATEAEA